MQNTDNRKVFYNLGLWIYALFYIVAGINHFISTKIYYAIMPKWLPEHSFLIYLSGFIEVALGILLLFKHTRKLAAILIILMLIAFMPAHVYMIQIAPFMLGKTLVTPFISWIRLPFQVIFALWAWHYYRYP